MWWCGGTGLFSTRPLLLVRSHRRSLAGNSLAESARRGKGGCSTKQEECRHAAQAKTAQPALCVKKPYAVPRCRMPSRCCMPHAACRMPHAAELRVARVLRVLSRFGSTPYHSLATATLSFPDVPLPSCNPFCCRHSRLWGQLLDAAPAAHSNQLRPTRHLRLIKQQPALRRRSATQDPAVLPAAALPRQPS